MPGRLLLTGGPRELHLWVLQQPIAAFAQFLLSPEYFPFALQGARGFPGTPGLPGVKGHRVSIRGKGVGEQGLPEEETFGGVYVIFCVGSQMCDGSFLLFPRVTQGSMVLREKLVLQV